MATRKDLTKIRTAARRLRAEGNSLAQISAKLAEMGYLANGKPYSRSGTCSLVTRKAGGKKVSRAPYIKSTSAHTAPMVTTKASNRVKGAISILKTDGIEVSERLTLALMFLEA